MSFLTWLEATAYAEYVRVAAYGYAAMITLHSLGLAIMVGLSVLLSLRALGLYKAIPLEALYRLLPLAWVGFVVNLYSGTSLFVSQATTYVTDFTFLSKMLFVLIGAACVALLQDAIAKTPEARATADAGADAAAVPDRRRAFAAATIVAWAGAMIAGRLIAYY